MLKLDCSINGESSLSPKKAMVTLLKETKSIEEHLNFCRRKIDGSICEKNENADYIVIGKKDFEPRFFEQFQSALWVSYFNKNENIENNIRKQNFTDFISTDEEIYGDYHLEIIKKYIKMGRFAVRRDYAELRELLSKDSVTYSSYKEKLFDTKKVKANEINDLSNSVELNTSKDKEVVISEYEVEIKKIATKEDAKLKVENKKTEHDILDKNPISIIENKKPVNPDKVLKIFKYGNENYKIIKKNSFIIAFSTKRTYMDKIPLSVFNTMTLKNISLNDIYNNYKQT
ncbi:MAG: hypothetical protein IJH34_14835, partial [Romboutsia sp.]|nr:hypothetical protein [Romboutsia sp.]